MNKKSIFKKFAAAFLMFVLFSLTVLAASTLGGTTPAHAKEQIDKADKYEIEISQDDNDDNEEKYAKDEYPARLRAPDSENPYYYSRKNVFEDCGYGLPNCTAYAWGRTYELNKEYPELCTADAGNWYGYNKEHGIYDYGKEPKLGAVVCWDNADGGHVAIVEKIEGNIITLSNSAYKSTEFFLTKLDVTEENLGYIGWEFQGFIYSYES
ncbi:MAG: CHAP domain-containing protein [Oscillospiraceae bacterium]|nr:CHAP domain-containing protein [Oscillospiraceae bacterium]